MPAQCWLLPAVILLAQSSAQANAPLQNSSFDFGVPPFSNYANCKDGVLILKGVQTGEITLVLPAKLIRELRGQSVSLQDSPGEPETWSGRRLPMVVAGLALSLAVVSGGLCVLRSRRRLALAGVLFLAGTAALVGVGCPSTRFMEVDYRPHEMTADGKFAGDAILQPGGDTNEVRVLLNKEALAYFACQANLKTEPAP